MAIEQNSSSMICNSAFIVVFDYPVGCPVQIMLNTLAIAMVNYQIYDVHPVFMERMHNCRQTFTIGFLCTVNRLIETAQNTW